MNIDINPACQCYEAYLNGVPVAFRAVINQPGVIYNLKRGSRVVVLPDYQGIGIGYALSSFIAQHYGRQGYVFDIVTSAKNFIYKLNKSSDWRLVKYGVRNDIDRRRGKNQPIRDRSIATFRYIGEGHAPEKMRLKMSKPRLSKKRTKRK